MSCEGLRVCLFKKLKYLEHAKTRLVRFLCTGLGCTIIERVAHFVLEASITSLRVRFTRFPQSKYVSLVTVLLQDANCSSESLCLIKNHGTHLRRMSKTTLFILSRPASSCPWQGPQTRRLLSMRQEVLPPRTHTVFCSFTNRDKRSSPPPL
jgi:hypothetical protein